MKHVDKLMYLSIECGACHKKKNKSLTRECTAILESHSSTFSLEIVKVGKATSSLSQSYLGKT